MGKTNKDFYCDFEDWFDISNPVHRAAYIYLRAAGIWPKDFVPGNVRMNACWPIFCGERYIEWLENRICELENSL